MKKLLRCRDLGPDCNFEACGDSAEETWEIALNHARAIHGLKEIPEKELLRIRKEAIQDAFCVPKGGYNIRGAAVH